MHKFISIDFNVLSSSCCEELSKLILIQVKNTSLHFEKQSMARTT